MANANVFGALQEIYDTWEASTKEEATIVDRGEQEEDNKLAGTDGKLVASTGLGEPVAYLDQEPVAPSGVGGARCSPLVWGSPLLT